MRVYDGSTSKGRIREKDVHMFHVGARQQFLRAYTAAIAKGLKKRNRREARAEIKAALEH